MIPCAMVPKADECYSTVAYLELKKKKNDIKNIFHYYSFKIAYIFVIFTKKGAQLKWFLYKN